MSALLGVLGAILTPRILEWRNRTRIKKALLWELENLLPQLDTIHFQLRDAIYELTLGVWDQTVPMNLSNPVFINSYKDVCSHFNAAQAFSFGLIHGTVERINRLNERISDLCDEGAKKPSGELVRTALQKAAAQYENVRTLEWHVRYHLKYSDNPELIEQTNDARRQFVAAKNQIKDDLHALIAKANEADSHEFRKKHVTRLTIEVDPPTDHE